MNLNELSSEEIKHWALFAGSILEKLFGKVRDKAKLAKLYYDAKKKNTDKRYQDALDYFYNYRLQHMHEDINVKQIIEQIKIEQLVENIVRKTLKNIK